MTGTHRPSNRRSKHKDFSVALVTTVVALVLAIPVLSVLWHAVFTDSSSWQHLADTVLSDYVWQSFWLCVWVASGVLVLGISCAWLTSRFEFPGSRVFSWALLLPLAFPAYIIAYAYTDLLDFAGPVQTSLRELTGWGFRDYWFPPIRSLGGAALMLTLVLYPYVFMLSRASFMTQSGLTAEAARSLGASRLRTFWRVDLPLARPAIVAGTSLALMETLADYGTVSYFGVSSFSAGIFRTWHGLGDMNGAMQLAALLLTVVVVLLSIERYSRRRQRVDQLGLAPNHAPPKLQGWRAWLATGWCTLPLLLGFLVPVAMILSWLWQKPPSLDEEFVELIGNSMLLAIAAALITLSLAILLSWLRRFYPRPWIKPAVASAGLGYAVPGTVIAIGILVPLAALDRQLNAWLLELSDWRPGLIFSGTVFALLFAYAVRFMAVALNSVQAGMSQISPSLDRSARSLGHGRWSVMRRIQLPMLTTSLLTAALLVFVDVLKELPATLILRPFNFDTLAVKAHELAADERLLDAGPVALTIVLVGLLPVILLSRNLRHPRSDQ
ncbi:iron ABC transporter permease [Bacterioplanes sanyensis]|uniref:Iron ABC transporter permease n=1 Tax=Bacterioplanes sanyensis TaxID=1249553 RepID=A0A222FLR1_9GAMM|nr:iron ABC transporter permease [Bacterioplanes sanyensis]ASP39454.1 iron ABC transporter permease [Bacterioplanes sanyensis]